MDLIHSVDTGSVVVRRQPTALGELGGRYGQPSLRKGQRSVFQDRQQLAKRLPRMGTPNSQVQCGRGRRAKGIDLSAPSTSAPRSHLSTSATQHEQIDSLAPAIVHFGAARVRGLLLVGFTACFGDEQWWSDEPRRQQFAGHWWVEQRRLSIGWCCVPRRQRGRHSEPSRVAPDWRRGGQRRQRTEQCRR